MTSLDRNLRKQLENKVKDARRVAEAGARQSIEQLAVHHHEPWSALTPDQRKLRSRLRAHGRQLGDRLDERRGTQPIDRLVAECAYEHWHRLLFARFLAENDLLVEPQSGMALSLDECRELARERGLDWLVLASDFAQRMLPQIFRAEDPVLEVTLPPEKRQQLEALLEGLPREVFVANDSLGWVYQFWQAEQKDRVNKSQRKIGADELPAVTQIFTEDYMVLFLLHNTLGAWWAGKAFARRPELARSAASEDELRDACALPGVDWAYLRFLRDGNNQWYPAAGTFEGWPRMAKDITLLDPCMGSGHFLVFALAIVSACRAAEEGLPREEAVAAALRDNLFGLEIDPRCTQIAAFNLALAAWRMSGYRMLPPLNLACSGSAINARETDWIALAGDDVQAQGAMKQLFALFQKAPTLGSLIEPLRVGGELFVAGFQRAQPLLNTALAREVTDEAKHELAVAARGVSAAAHILARTFMLVATNVPYLGRGKQSDELREHCERDYPAAKADLATCFTLRCLSFCRPGGTIAVVTPQNWLFLGGYRRLRETLLRGHAWSAVVKLGPAAFHDMNFWAATTALAVISRAPPASDAGSIGIDVSEPRSPDEKASLLQTVSLSPLRQAAQLLNPDARIVLGAMDQEPLLSTVASYGKGSTTGDSPHYHRYFWELPTLEGRTATPWLDSPDPGDPWSGRQLILIVRPDDSRLRQENGCRIHGQEVWGRSGVAVNKMNELRAFIYTGEVFDDNVGVIAPADPTLTPAVFSYCESGEYVSDLREIDQAVKVTAATLVKVPFDRDRWQEVARERYPAGLPPAHTKSAAQWLFHGHPRESQHPLHVGVARLLGYAWPRQTGSSFPHCPPLHADGLERHADEDGIVCLPSLRGETSAADRLRGLLVQALGAGSSAASQNALLASAGFTGKSLDDWLRDGFFEQHCEIFQQRPFVWHVWDGQRNGFGALVNYHRLAAPGGEGRRTLEKLIYTYLGDWIDRQRADQKNAVEGADGRVAAAEHLKHELERILEGERPYDIFVRWKPLHKQPVGWEPDLDDGVRINVRPFMMAKLLNARGRSACILRVNPKIKWDKDRGREASRPQGEYPWFWGWDEQTWDFLGGPEFDATRWNDLHYARDVKLAARERANGGKS